MDFWTSLLGGGVIVALIESARGLVAWILKRKAEKEDRAEDRADKRIEERIGHLEDDMAELHTHHEDDMAQLHTHLKDDMAELHTLTAALAESQKNVLFDRIRYLCRRYLADGEIDFDDLRAVNALHNSYHNGLGGNGDLDALMKQVRELPVKPKK